MIKVTETQINDVIGKTIDAMSGSSKWPGMSYEEGVQAALDWVLGDGPDPMSDEE